MTTAADTVATGPALIRAAGLFVPLLAVVLAAAVRRPGRADVAAAIVGGAWQLALLPGLNLLAGRLGWWSFQADGGTVVRLPVDLLLGWVLLWGVLPPLAAARLPWPVTAALLGWLDLAAMPLLDPVLRLGDRWLTGEAVAIALCLLPGLLLARWTARAEHLRLRAAGQVLLAALLMLALPATAAGVRLPHGAVLSTGLQVLAVPMLLGVAAVREFVVRGSGTPLPYDPPLRLVTSGPYAYVRNPIQLSLLLCHLVLAAFTANAWLLVAAGVTVAYSAGLAAWHEGAQLAERFGPGWAEYTAGVRSWLPRLRPWPGTAPAELHVAQTCGVCSGVGRWVLDRSPVALTVRPAEEHPAGLRRITYESADGRERAEGVAALGRALQHFHLGWALLGWVLLIPGLAWFAQLVADATAGGPRELRTPAERRPAEPPSADLL
ncbi:isoprenylcysteine carboxylmethyltransferase family protein [Kitasatospora sp. NBC_00070]|uniref:methyltransferase family protein n=1 Tax=Kitasatospora sp. NBC_00070 TaxID=2975962 RepID=UPI003243DCF9